MYQNLPAENNQALRESLITIGNISSGEKQQNEIESQADNIQDFINFISARGENSNIQERGGTAVK